jgi:hypothetical protein
MNGLIASLSLSEPSTQATLPAHPRKSLYEALRAFKWPALTRVLNLGSSQVPLGQSRTETDIWVYVGFYVICPIYHLKV